jgi:U3 small nucleolar RNA-associated protein 11
MSSLRNAVKRREHKERGQLQERRKLGLLEKHKDYVLRARDYNKKQRRLQQMQLKAAARNPDEFYFRMANSRTEGGVHVSDNNHAAQLAPETLAALKTQDLAYVQMKRAVDLRKAEKLTAGLHFLEAPTASRHTVFVDDAAQLKNFDLARHFDTAPELADRAFNRPRTAALKAMKLAGAPADQAAVRKMRKERDGVYRELSERLERAGKLGRMGAKLDMERKVQAKGKKMKVKAAADGLPAVYKWKQQRQK